MKSTGNSQCHPADFLDLYNENWSEHLEDFEDGSRKEVMSPKPPEAEFKAKMTLESIGVIGDGLVEFYYDDEFIFWGHAIVIISGNGTDCSEACSELFD
jgi:hypothetical protein